jgi:hypothetical protein
MNRFRQKSRLTYSSAIVSPEISFCWQRSHNCRLVASRIVLVLLTHATSFRNLVAQDERPLLYNGSANRACKASRELLK